MTRIGTTTALIATMIARVAVAQAPTTDTELRAAFCIGALDEGIEDSRQPFPPMYLTPDGRGYTPPDDARRMQEYINGKVSDYGQKRERLRQFVLPFWTGNSSLAFAVARNEGRRVYQECIAAIGKGADGKGAEVEIEPCVRVRLCFHLRCRRDLCWNLTGGLRLDEDTWSGSKVNRLIGEFLGQALPSVHFAHGDLT
jgi:hypothetical protein